MLEELVVPFQYDYMLRAMGISALVGGVAGLLSCYVVLKGWSLMGDALSHAVVPGVVLGAIFWLATMTTLLPSEAVLRLTIGASIVAVYAALTSGELWNERRRSMQRRWPAIVIPVMHGCVLMLPILLGDLLRAHDENFAHSIWVTVFAVELVRANLNMMRYVYSPRINIRPGIVRISIGLKSPIGRLALANTIALTPGSLVVDIEDDALFVHWLDVKTADQAEATGIIAGPFVEHLEKTFG